MLLCNTLSRKKLVLISKASKYQDCCVSLAELQLAMPYFVSEQFTSLITALVPVSLFNDFIDNANGFGRWLMSEGAFSCLVL